MRNSEEVPDWTDAWFYGIIPAALYLLLGAVAVGFAGGQGWAIHGLAAVITAMLLSCIRNEWDLVTWLAPRQDVKDPFAGEREHGTSE